MNCNINIIGRGNVAHHLSIAFDEVHDFKVTTVNPHNFDGLDPSADVILIAVSDSAIKSVAEKLHNLLISNSSDFHPTVAHTSGSTPIEVLSMFGQNYGVLYPLQTFSKDVELEYEKIPFFIEADNRHTEDKLIALASMISGNVSKADSNQRRALHLASVLACNFTNHLWALADKFLSEYNLPFDALTPLIMETTRKAMSNSPAAVQTGPAARNDINTINSHLDLLQKDANLQQIYSLLSNSIIESTKNKKPQS